MRELLGEKDSRRLNLIETISIYPGITIDELAIKLKTSSIQIQTDIGFFSEDPELLQIIVQKNKECYIKTANQASFRLVYRFFLQHNLNFQLLEKIFLTKYDSYEKLAAELFISQATLKRSIGFINSQLEPFEMRIKSRPVGLTGTEENIRGFYSFYFQECYPDMAYPFDHTSQKIAVALIDSLLPFFTSKRNYASRNRLIVQTSVALYRERRGFSGFQEIVFPTTMTTQLELGITKFSRQDIFKLYLGRPLTPELVKSIFHLFFNGHYAFSLTDYRERLEKSAINRQLYQGVTQLITQLGKKLTLPVQNLELFSLKIYNVLAITHSFTITPYILHRNREAFTMLSAPLKGKILRIAKRLFYHYLPEVAARNDAYFYEVFYLLITHWQGFYELLLAGIPPCRIGLLFNSDIEHMRYVNSHLTFLYGKKITITELLIEDLKELPKVTADLDLLLINFILPSEIKLPLPHISVVDVISQDDTYRIERQIDRLYYQNTHE